MLQIKDYVFFKKGKRLGRVAQLAVAGAGLALSGCGNSPYPAGLTKENVYFMSQAEDPRRLNPAVSYRVAESYILDVICPSYYEYHPFKTKVFELKLMLGAKPAVREKHRFVDAKTKKVITGERWTFEIRKDLRFQDDPCFPGGKGRHITAKDFVYAFHRMADPGVGSPVLNFFSDKMIGLQELVDRNAERQKKKLGADYETPIAGIKLDPKDPYKFTVDFNQPYPQMRYMMAMHFTTPMPHEAVKFYGKDIDRHPVGCGPYVLEEWTPKRRIVLAKNPHRPHEVYPSDGEPGDAESGLLKAAGRQLPLLDKVVISTIPENTTGWNLFLQGYMDHYAVSQSNYQQAVSQTGNISGQMAERGVRLEKANDVAIQYFAFNMSDPVVGGYTPEKRKLRQAISLAINSQDYIDLFAQGNGVPGQGVIPPGIFGYEPSYKNRYRQFDPKMKLAKQLLAEAGYPNGIEKKTGDRLSLYYDNNKTDATGRQWIGLLAKQLDAIGVRLESRPQRDVVWLAKVDAGDFQFTSYSWYVDYPDAENFTFLFYGPNKRPGPNVSAYNNPKYDALFLKMRSLDDGPERMKLIREMRAILEEDCPMIYNYHPQALQLFYGWLGPIKANPASNTYLKYREVDSKDRVAKQVAWNQPVLWPLILMLGGLVIGTVPAVQVVKNRHRRRVTGKGS